MAAETSEEPTARATTPTDPVAVVRAFLAALERLDVDAAMALCDPEVTYQNVPLKPAQGHHEVTKVLRLMTTRARGFEVRYINIAADGPVVLTERTDIITLGPVAGDFWVCGTFEVHDGLITVWRDRFDWFDLGWSFVRGAARAATSKLRGGEG